MPQDSEVNPETGGPEASEQLVRGDVGIMSGCPAATGGDRNPFGRSHGKHVGGNEAPACSTKCKIPLIVLSKVLSLESAAGSTT
jgi:hypothetical protein